MRRKKAPSFRKVSWKIIRRLPQFIKGPIIRKLYSSSNQQSFDLVFKRADTHDEIDQAASLLYQSYLDSGLLPEREISKHLTKFHALPNTCILVAKIKSEVIATISIIPDSALGLPIDELWDLGSLRKAASRLGELSGLAIRKDFRGSRGNIILPLSRLLKEYCQILGVDCLTIVTHPDVADFYRSLLLFTPVSKKSKGDAKVQGAPAFGQYLFLGSPWMQNLKSVFGVDENPHNIYRLMANPLPTNIVVPDSHYSNLGYAFQAAEYLKRLFDDQLHIFSALTKEQVLALKNVYGSTNYIGVFNQYQDDSHPRSRTRFMANFAAQIRHKETQQTRSAQILDISSTGLLLKAETIDFDIDEELVLEIEGKSRCELKCKVAWTNQNLKLVGLYIVGVPPAFWLEQVTNLENLLAA